MWFVKYGRCGFVSRPITLSLEKVDFHIHVVYCSASKSYAYTNKSFRPSRVFFLGKGMQEKKET